MAKRRKSKMRAGTCRIVGRGKKKRCMCKQKNGRVKSAKMSRCY